MAGVDLGNEGVDRYIDIDWFIKGGPKGGIGLIRSCVCLWLELVSERSICLFV